MKEEIIPVKILVLMNATGSMGSPLQILKNSINEIFDRAGKILE
jgi:hypothetical protein